MITCPTCERCGQQNDGRFDICRRCRWTSAMMAIISNDDDYQVKALKAEDN